MNISFVFGCNKRESIHKKIFSSRYLFVDAISVHNVKRKHIYTIELNTTNLLVMWLKILKKQQYLAMDCLFFKKVKRSSVCAKANPPHRLKPKTIKNKKQ